MPYKHPGIYQSTETLKTYTTIPNFDARRNSHMKYWSPGRSESGHASPVALQGPLGLSGIQSNRTGSKLGSLINNSKILTSQTELKAATSTRSTSLMENLRKKIKKHAKEYDTNLISKKMNNVSIQLPDLSIQGFSDGPHANDQDKENKPKLAKGKPPKLNIIKEEIKEEIRRPLRRSRNASKTTRLKKQSQTLPENRMDDSTSEAYSEAYSEDFSENDLYSSSFYDNDKTREKEALYKAGSKNYKEYRERSNILPRKMGFQGENEKKGNMFLRSFYIGNTYANPLSKGIKDLDTLQKINLSRCGLKDEGFIKIIQNAPYSLQELDISGNSNFGIKCYEELAKIVSKRDIELVSLNMENNKAGDTAIKIIMDSLIYNGSLKCLNINKNCITDLGAQYITEMVQCNSSISVLLMNWNKILSKGGVSVCTAVGQNKNIQVFDISFNNIGSKNGTKMAETFKKLFLENKTLIHLDISHCKFTIDELKIMNEGLKRNHSILGLHMVGNKGKIDTLGFIDPEVDSDIAITHISSRLSSELQTGKVK